MLLLFDWKSPVKFLKKTTGFKTYIEFMFSKDLFCAWQLAVLL